ncbi:hypothetical protein STCU_07404 [Strigomonas culicis]|uniref:BSD domain-containing protein n=1 Tax=Strigomonas culicis TaxID=28005 RepID=S9VA70_9TRYP|nr:hypothetical protein STCU_07404 [Strigomonas culicis]|eukprot:EPY23886.1 hypothetical protein STCU_07404 [Strigomonas culicis]
MSTVDLLTNPSPRCECSCLAGCRCEGAHTKEQTHLASLWVPNNTMKKHQFRLIMLKGLVECATEAADNYGVLVELIPPPTDPDAAVDASHYPGGCSVTVKVKGANGSEVVQTEMSVLNSSNLQMSFSEIIPHAMLEDANYFNEEDSSMTLEINIQTGLNLTTVQVARTVSSLWSALSSSVAQLLDTTTHIYHEARNEFERADPTPPPAPARPLPWDEVPPKWASRAEAWHKLVYESIVEDDGVFLYCSTTMTSDQSTLLVSVGFSPHSIEGAYEHFNYDRDVHMGLLTNHQLAHQRYLLVPRKIQEEAFWANYFWKVACLAQCEDDTQVKALLSVLNAPPLPKPRVPVIEKMTEEEIASLTRDAAEAASLLQEYLADRASKDDTFLIQAAAGTCEGHKNQLDPVFRRTDLSEATLAKVGATLRSLREQLQAYEADKKRRSGAAAPHTAESSAGAPAEQPPQEQGRAPPTTREDVPQADEAGRTAARADPPTTPSPAEKAATSSPVAPRVSDVRTPAATDAPQKSSENSASKPSVEFPKMPWEDDDD